ncbi:DUF3261 domain-containing protein [Chimaeribacter californicus]|uniref:DUF3261 domain-containing protein n=1 Tax=Chimaeribacter californicus TaxID=2060067 RepID=UPI00240A81C0|nr:DUF3261 domain-containing protein [Chimaeribacter californicus]
MRVTLPAPGISPAIHGQQLLTGTFKGQQQSLVVLLNADAQRLSLAGLSSLGIRLFQLTYDAQGIHTRQALVLPDLPPAAQVLADVMLGLWPVEAWQGRLPPGWTLNDEGDTRRLCDEHGKRVTEIRYQRRHGQRKPVSLEQYVFGYHITIQHLDD